VQLAVGPLVGPLLWQQVRERSRAVVRSLLRGVWQQHDSCVGCCQGRAHSVRQFATGHSTCEMSVSYRCHCVWASSPQALARVAADAVHLQHVVPGCCAQRHLQW
jgi:hypothetical protein